MKCGYDNLDDARSKLLTTYCYYNGRAVYVKYVNPVDPIIDNGKYTVGGHHMTDNTPFDCNLEDPLFNCADYNIGYVNNRLQALWFYRLPLKQYKQGLRWDQIQSKGTLSAMKVADFKALKPVGLMLENKYPTFQQAVSNAKAGVHVAFHKNFAMSYDSVHEDFIVAYKGVDIGHTKNCEDFKILKQFGHLYESLKEAVGG
jgi:hypothetical protein